MRLLILGDAHLLMTRVPLAAFVDAAQQHPQIELIGLCDAGTSDPTALSACLSDELRQAAKALFSPSSKRPGPKLNVLHHIARERGLPVLTPPGRDLNDPAFREELIAQWRPTALLSLGCLQILKPELLAVFETAVNFHNGLLPGYRGLNATAWSLYNGEAETGYSFHRMTLGIDEGDVLVEGSLPVTPDLSVDAANLEKCVAAARHAHAVLEAMVSNELERPQAGGGYYSRKDRKRICRIPRPAELTSSEILRRLACFGLLEIKIRGQRWEVTELAETGNPSFETADGRLAVRRALFLPPTLYRAYRRLRS